MKPKEKHADKKNGRETKTLAKPDGRGTSGGFKNTTEQTLQKVETKTAVAKVPSQSELMAMIHKTIGTLDVNLIEHIVEQIHECTISTSSNGLDVAIAMLQEMKSGTLTESLLVVQMAAVHNTAMAFMSKATLAGQPYRDSDSNLARAVSSMRLFKDQLETLLKLQGRTAQQKVTVEHVHVNAGGRAILGAINTAGQKNVEPDSSEKHAGIQ